MNTTRLVELDFVKAVCMLWIVGFWHMGEVSGFHSSNTATYLLTIGALSTFVYVSAFWHLDIHLNQRRMWLNFI